MTDDPVWWENSRSILDTLTIINKAFTGIKPRMTKESGQKSTFLKEKSSYIAGKRSMIEDSRIEGPLSWIGLVILSPSFSRISVYLLVCDFVYFNPFVFYGS